MQMAAQRLNWQFRVRKMLPDDKTYMIAQKVGYQEQNYFSYVFKKRYGMSPTKYRVMQADAQ